MNKWHLENAALAAVLADHAKCTRQLAQIAAKRQRFHSNLLKVGPFIVESVIKSIRNTELL